MACLGEPLLLATLSHLDRVLAMFLSIDTQSSIRYFEVEVHRFTKLNI